MVMFMRMEARVAGDLLAWACWRSWRSFSLQGHWSGLNTSAISKAMLYERRA